MIKIQKYTNYYLLYCIHTFIECYASTYCSADFVSYKYLSIVCLISSCSSDPPPLYGILGKIRFSLLKHKCAAALDIINTYSAHHTDFMPLYLEKIKVQVALADWEGAMETAKR